MNKEKFVETVENYMDIDRKLRSYVYEKYTKEMNEYYNGDFAVEGWGLKDSNTKIWVVVQDLENCRISEQTITFDVNEFIEWENKEDK